MQTVVPVSERRACRGLAQPRRTQRRPARVPRDEPALIARLIALARRFGSRRITALLRAEGWRVNHKRVERRWRQEGLRVPRSPAPAAALGHRWLLHASPGGAAEPRLVLRLRPRADAGRAAPVPPGLRGYVSNSLYGARTRFSADS